jgi:hypothetical protein
LTELLALYHLRNTLISSTSAPPAEIHTAIGTLAGSKLLAPEGALEAGVVGVLGGGGGGGGGGVLEGCGGGVLAGGGGGVVSRMPLSPRSGWASPPLPGSSLLMVAVLSLGACASTGKSPCAYAGNSC